MIDAIRSGMAKLAAIGAIRRRGIGGLQAYGGKIEGEGHVIHKDEDGNPIGRTDFSMKGQPGQRN